MLREIEKNYCEYLFLGLPEACFSDFLRFTVKKGFPPCVLASKKPYLPCLLGLAKYTELSCGGRDEIFLEALELRASRSGARRTTLIPTPDSADFIKRNSDRLRRRFLIEEFEEIIK